MARQYARIFLSIWADPGFTALTADEQAVYLRLLTGPGLSMCGVTDWRPARLVKSFRGMTREALEGIGDRLQAARFIVLDRDTEEVLVRSFVRHDGVLKSPNLVKAMANDWIEIGSDAIKQSVAWEVRRGLRDDPDAKGSGAVPEWFPSPTEPSANPSETLSDDFPNGSASDPVETDSEPKGNTNGTLPEGFPDSSQGVLVGFPHPSTHNRNQQPSTVNLPTPSASGAAAPSAQTLLAEWIDHRRETTGANPTGRVKGQLAKEIGNLLDEGQPYEHVRAGLQLWDTKGAHPSTLASFVDEARRPKSAPRAKNGIDWDAAMQRAHDRDQGEFA